MAELSPSEKFERARNSKKVAEERLLVIEKRLPALQSELEELIVRNEVQGYKGRTIERTREEIASLQNEKVTMEQTIVALQKRLPELEIAAMLEQGRTVTMHEYQTVRRELGGVLQAIPSLDSFNREIDDIRAYTARLGTVKTSFLRLSKELATLMTDRDLTRLDDLRLETLRDDRANIDNSLIITLSDALIDIGKKINDLQYALFRLATENPLELRLPPEKQPEPIISPCGQFRIVKADGVWRGFKKETSFANGQIFEDWRCIRETQDEITFEELKAISRKMMHKHEAPKPRTSCFDRVY